MPEGGSNPGKRRDNVGFRLTTEDTESTEVSMALGAHSELTEQIIGAAIEVHREPGPGLLESAYLACLFWELMQRELTVCKEVPLPIRYKNVSLDVGYRMDLVVGDRVIVEIKSIDRLMPIHSAQLLTYLRLADLQVGLLINFNVLTLENGLKRLML